MGTTWNPSDKSANVTLSSGNMKASNTGYGAVRATNSISAGAKYFEIYINSTAYTDIGIGLSSASLAAHVGYDASGWGYGAWSGWKYHGGSAVSAYGAKFVTGNVIGVAIDMTAGKIWFAINNTWQNSGNPATGANPAFTGIAGSIFPMVSGLSSGDVVTLRVSSLDCTYSPPTGFEYWDLIPMISGTLKTKESDASGVAADYAIVKRSDGSLLVAGTAAANGTYDEVTADFITEYDIMSLDPNGVYNPKITEKVVGV